MDQKKQRKPLTPEQLEKLAKAREKAMEAKRKIKEMTLDEKVAYEAKKLQQKDDRVARSQKHAKALALEKHKAELEQNGLPVEKPPPMLVPKSEKLPKKEKKSKPDPAPPAPPPKEETDSSSSSDEEEPPPPPPKSKSKPEKKKKKKKYVLASSSSDSEEEIVVVRKKKDSRVKIPYGERYGEFANQPHLQPMPTYRQELGSTRQPEPEPVVEKKPNPFARGPGFNPYTYFRR